MIKTLYTCTCNKIKLQQPVCFRDESSMASAGAH